MIKFKREQVTKPRTETIYLEHKCDICKRDSPNKGLNDWDEDHYGFDEIEISRRKGASYPGDHWTDLKQEVHLCPECWENVFLPWLRDTYGAAPSDMTNEFGW